MLDGDHPHLKELVDGEEREHVRMEILRHLHHHVGEPIAAGSASARRRVCSRAKVRFESQSYSVMSEQPYT